MANSNLPLSDVPSDFESAERWQQTLGWHPNTEQRQQFEQLYTELLAGNQRLNLTRITDAAEFWDKHLWDSLRGIAPWLAGPDHSDLGRALQRLAAVRSLDALRVIDIGTGGGFPGVPVAMVRPQWQVSLLDSTRKKVAFLASMVQALGLANVRGICDRIEPIAQHPQHREQYDLALIRAVGPATVCAEYALPCLQINGIAVLYRGQWTPAEHQHLHQAVHLLGGTIIAASETQTPLGQGTRHYIYVQKQTPTPAQYPRATGIPTKRPLGID